MRRALGSRFAGVHDHMPAHSPRDAVVACANAARAAGTDLLVTFGGGSVTDGGKAVTICLEHGVVDVDGMEPFRTIVTNGKRVGWDRGADRASNDADVSSIPPIIPYGGFSPVRLEGWLVRRRLPEPRSA